jgi:hypothetical protein
MGMTWGIKVQRVVFALAAVAALALASGADWLDFGWLCSLAW